MPTTALFMQWPEDKRLVSTPSLYLERSTSSELPRLGQATVARDLCGNLSGRKKTCMHTVKSEDLMKLILVCNSSVLCGYLMEVDREPACVTVPGAR